MPAVGNPKEEILSKVRAALGRNEAIAKDGPEMVSPVFVPFEDPDLSVTFAQNFIKNKGIFFFCENEKEFAGAFKAFIRETGISSVHVREASLIKILTESSVPFTSSEYDFENSDAGVTSCESLIARTGSIITTSANASGRSIGIYPPLHVVVAYTSQITAEIDQGLRTIKNKYKGNIPSMICMETGPSRTADIEKTLVLGAHGPKELILFLIDDSLNS